MAAALSRPRELVRAFPPASLSFVGLLGSGPSNLDQTNGLIWVMIAIGAAGAFVTFAFLVYALWKFRDPKVRRRRYG